MALLQLLLRAYFVSIRLLIEKEKDKQYYEYRLRINVENGRRSDDYDERIRKSEEEEEETSLILGIPRRIEGESLETVTAIDSTESFA